VAGRVLLVRLAAERSFASHLCQRPAIVPHVDPTALLLICLSL
jgi:hypothetical protein